MESSGGVTGIEISGIDMSLEMVAISLDRSVGTGTLVTRSSRLTARLVVIRIRAIMILIIKNPSIMIINIKRNQVKCARRELKDKILL